MKSTVGFGDLTDEALPAVHDFLAVSRIACVLCEPPQVAMPVRQIHRTRVGAEVRGQKAEHVLAELFQTLFSLDPQAEPRLPRSEPCLGLSRAVVARHDHAGDRDQENQQRRSTPRHSRRQRDRVLPFRLTTFERCSRV